MTMQRPTACRRRRCGEAHGITEGQAGQGQAGAQSQEDQRLAAAAKVLAEAGKPMNCQEMIQANGGYVSTPHEQCSVAFFPKFPAKYH